jgi:hypothetical protein
MATTVWSLRTSTVEKLEMIVKVFNREISDDFMVNFPETDLDIPDIIDWLAEKKLKEKEASQ